jgi:hypothetical protein
MKRRSKKRAPKKQAAASAPLPPPVDVQPAAAEQEKPGVLASIKNVFRMPSPQPSPAAPSDSAYAASLTSEPGDGQPDERLLSQIPATVSDDPAGAGPQIIDDAPAADDPISALMAQISFEEEDVKAYLSEFFEWMAERFESDHWKLTDRQQRILGRPTAQLMNSMWAQLCARFPEIIARWCESTPGAAAFLAAFGLVVVPKAWTQIRVSRARKNQKQVPNPGPVVATENQRHAVPRVMSPGGVN